MVNCHSSQKPIRSSGVLARCDFLISAPSSDLDGGSVVRGCRCPREGLLSVRPARLDGLRGSGLSPCRFRDWRPAAPVRGGDLTSSVTRAGILSLANRARGMRLLARSASAAEPGIGIGVVCDLVRGTGLVSR